MDSIVIRGAREHNLKNIDVVVPRNKFVVITGVSGSGKSSLAFDTIFAEGQRRYVESLSAYARQFLEQMEKKLEGLLQAYLRLLFAARQAAEYLHTTDPEGIKRDLAKLQKTLALDPPKVQEINRKRIEILTKRLEKFGA